MIENERHSSDKVIRLRAWNPEQERANDIKKIYEDQSVRPIYCINCAFYPCQLYAEYRQFSMDHIKTTQSLLDYRSYDLEDFRDLDKLHEIATLHPPRSDDYLYNRQQQDEYNNARDRAQTLMNKYNCVFNMDSFPGEGNRSTHFCMKECGDKRVSDGIGEDYKQWGTDKPVLIWAPTGRGKNYFITNVLIPYVTETSRSNRVKQKVLIVSNRLALKTQVKESLDEDDTIYHLGEFADVITYQSLLGRKETFEKNQKRSEKKHKEPLYSYVVLDEAHFITSDAIFNPDTERIMKMIPEVFCECCRIYMSATPYECFKYIRKEDTWTPQVYHFSASYDYLDIGTFHRIEDLYSHIADNVCERKQKWLIFIDDKQQLEKVATSLRKELKNRGCKSNNPVLAVSADSKADSRFQEMVKQEKLPSDTSVLLATSVLDNGVNLWGIDNIVVTDMDKVKCLQMVGRARVKEGERKTLYLKQFSISDVERLVRNLDSRLNAYYDYDTMVSGDQHSTESKFCFLQKYFHGSTEDWKLARNIFNWSLDRSRNSHGKGWTTAISSLYINEIARNTTREKFDRYKRVLDEIHWEEENRFEVGQHYMAYQWSWFGKVYEPDNCSSETISDSRKQALVSFLAELEQTKKEIIVEELATATENAISKKDFTEKFINLFDYAFGKSDKNSREYGKRKMNALLEQQNISYRIEGPEQKGPWRIVSVTKNETSGSLHE